MIDSIWTIIRQSNRFLLTTPNPIDRMWIFPCSGVESEVGIKIEKLRKLCDIDSNENHVQFLYCDKWHMELSPKCNHIIGVEWFTWAEMHALKQNLEPLVSDNLLYLAYIIQHYDHHPNEWNDPWRQCDKDG